MFDNKDLNKKFGGLNDLDIIYLSNIRLHDMIDRLLVAIKQDNYMELKNIHNENNTMKNDLLELKKGTRIIEYLRREYKDKAKDTSND